MTKLSASCDILVFDYDGVLADTEPLHWAGWRKLLAPYRIDLTWEQYCRYCRGVADVRMREALIEMSAQAINLPDLTPYLSARKQQVREWSLTRPPIPAKTIEMLRGLSGWRLGLVTSADRDDVEPVLHRANIQGCFEACVFGGDVTRHKPAPDPYLAIASRMGTGTGIAFEDSVSGMVSARAGGFHAVQVDHPDDLPRSVSEAIAIA